jgi:hypothetical protein
MLAAGLARNRLAEILNSAFAGGLLSQDTLQHRLASLFGSRLINPRQLIGDLTLRTRRRRVPAAKAAYAAWRRFMLGATEDDPMPLVLALNWANGEDDLVLGRGPDCDIAFENDSVSRVHARLVFRDGTWVIQDLDSTNGTIVNGRFVGRCQLQPGDRIEFGDQLVDID